MRGVVLMALLLAGCGKEAPPPKPSKEGVLNVVRSSSNSCVDAVAKVGVYLEHGDEINASGSATTAKGVCSQSQTTIFAMIGADNPLEPCRQMAEVASPMLDRQIDVLDAPVPSKQADLMKYANLYAGLRDQCAILSGPVAAGTRS